MKLAPIALVVIAAAAPALAQSSRPAPPKVPGALKVSAGETFRFVRKASISVAVAQGKTTIRKHAATFTLTYGLEVQAVTKKRIVWSLTIEQASGTESGAGKVALGPKQWKLKKPLTLQVASDPTGRLRGAENGKALLRFRQETGSAVATQYLFGDDPKAAGEPDGPLIFGPLLPGTPTREWTTTHGQAYGYLVADATRFREAWSWTTARAKRGKVAAQSKALKVEALEPLQEGVKVTPKVTKSVAVVVLDLRTGVPVEGGWASTFEIPVKKYGLTMTFKREEHLDPAPPKKTPAPPKKN